MFSYDEIQKYNETEVMIYKYVISNIEKIPYMTIRELANEMHISTSTLLRFCSKNGYDGYSEFKKAVKAETYVLKMQPPLEDLQELSLFLKEQIQVLLKEKFHFLLKRLKILTI
jgi:DNA-binding MurR/RpiR family transcriptional regulator